MKIKVLSLVFTILMAVLFNTINLFALDTPQITDGNTVTYERKNEHGDTKDTVVISSSNKAIQTIYAGGNQSAVLDTDGVLHLSGENDVGYINPEAFKNVKDVSLGYDQGIILKQDGSIITWGLDDLKKEFQLPDRLNNVKSIKISSNHILALQEDGKFAIYNCRDLIADLNITEYYNDLENVNKGFEPISIPVPETKELKEIETVIAPGYDSYWDFYIKGKDNRFIVGRNDYENNISIKELSTQGEIINKIVESSNYVFVLTQSGKVMKLIDNNKFETLEFENIKDISLTQTKLFLLGVNGILIVSDLNDDTANHKNRANYFDLNIKEVLRVNNIYEGCEIELIDTKNNAKIISIDYSNSLYKEINTDNHVSDTLYYKIINY